MANDEAKEGVIFSVENNRILFSDSSISIPTQGKNRLPFTVYVFLF